MANIGIRQQIQKASSVAQVSLLVTEAQTYKKITPATLRRIQRTAAKRLHELSNEIATKTTKKGKQ